MKAKRKRAPGGGRKRLGPSVARNLTIRIDDELRKRLEIEAASRARRKRNWNLSQEILMRLNQSIDRELDGGRDNAARAICYLISELIGLSLFSKYNSWHRDPFLFRSFRLAVSNFLSKIEPPGKIVAPAGFLTIILNTPELYAEYASENLLDDLHFKSTPEQREKAVRQLREDSGEEVVSQFLREEYGMERAQRHLGTTDDMRERHNRRRVSGEGSAVIDRMNSLSPETVRAVQEQFWADRKQFLARNPNHRKSK